MNNYSFEKIYYKSALVFGLLFGINCQAASPEESHLSEAIVEAVKSALKARDAGPHSSLCSTVTLEDLAANEISAETKASRQASIDECTEFLAIEDRTEFLKKAEFVKSQIQKWIATEEELAKTSKPSSQSPVSSMLSTSSSTNSSIPATPTNNPLSTPSPSASPISSPAINTPTSMPSMPSTSPINQPSTIGTPSSPTPSMISPSTPPAIGMSTTPSGIGMSPAPTSSPASSSPSIGMPTSQESPKPSDAKPVPEKAKEEPGAKTEDKPADSKSDSEGEKAPGGRGLRNLRERLAKAKGDSK